MKRKSDFSYWKKPWMKWTTLTVGAVQLPLFLTKLREYHRTLALVSPENRSQYIMQQKFSLSMNIMLAAGFLCAFVVGSLVKSKRAVDIADMVLLFGVAAFLSAALLLWGRAVNGILLWIVVACAAWGLWIYRLIRFNREKHLSAKG